MSYRQLIEQRGYGFERPELSPVKENIQKQDMTSLDLSCLNSTSEKAKLNKHHGESKAEKEETK